MRNFLKEGLRPMDKPVRVEELLPVLLKEVVDLTEPSLYGQASTHDVTRKHSPLLVCKAVRRAPGFGGGCIFRPALVQVVTDLHYDKIPRLEAA